MISNQDELIELNNVINYPTPLKISKNNYDLKSSTPNSQVAFRWRRT